MSNLLLRVLTSVLLLPLVLIILWLGGLFLGALLSFVMLLCAYELSSMIAPKKNDSAILACVMGLALLLTLMLLTKVNLVIPCFSIIFFIINMIFLFSKSADSQYIEKTCVIFYFVFYVALAFAALFWLREYNNFGDNYTGFSFVLLACIATWGNDTCAYFGGRFFGKHPLFKRVSAKKTWEGFIFGALGAIILVAIIYKISSSFVAFGLSVVDCFFITLPAMILAPLGDLIESRLKRIYEVKDSSQLLPGHGGFLDRIDSLLIVLPWTALYAFFIRPMW